MLRKIQAEKTKQTVTEIPKHQKLKSLKEQQQAERQLEKQHINKLKELRKTTEQQNAATRKLHMRAAPPKTAQQTIAYKKMYEDGICEIESGLYSKTFKITDINYQIARRDEQKSIFSRYCEVLNYCDPTMFLQISIINQHIDTDTFKESMYMKYVGDKLDKYRREMNHMLSAKVMEGQNSIIREKYITIGTNATSYETSIQTLSRLETDLMMEFKRLGCETESLNGLNRLAIMHDMLRPDDRFNWDYFTLLESGLTTKAAITPDSFNFKDSRKQYQFGDFVGQTVFIRDFPADMTDQLIAELSDLPIDMTITLHISSVAQDEALETVKKKLAFMHQQRVEERRKDIKGGGTGEIMSFELKYAMDEAEDLLDSLQNKNQRMFRVTILINTYATDLKSLNANVFQITSTAQKKTCKISNLDYMQEEGLNSTLPIGKNFVKIQRTLTTASTAIFIPFTSQELFKKRGIYYGLNALSHNLIMFDRRTLQNPNGVILGKPGSGKSFAAKREMTSVLLNDPNSEVIILDPEREYTSLANRFDGEVVHVSPSSKTFINPFDISLDYADDDDPIRLKADFVLSLCEVLVGGKFGLTGDQKSVIDRSVTLTYEPYFRNPTPKNIPTLQNFHKVLCDQPEPIAKATALALELYIKGNLSVFSHQSNVNTSKRLVIYDTKDLGKQLRTMGMLIVLDLIWNKVTQNRAIGKRTWIYIDEFQLLLQNEYSEIYFFELWSRARKWGAVPTGITQNVETLLLSDVARRILSNSSEFIMMMNQAPSDRLELAGLLNISNRQLEYITDVNEGHGLLFAGKSVVPFIDNFPRDTELYKMMTTKIEEVTTIEGASKITAAIS